MDNLYGTIAQSVALENDRAVLRFRTTYQPIGGPGAKIAPPTFPVPNPGTSPYIMESRTIEGEERPDVVLDQVPSQANRCETALLRAFREGRVKIPLIQLEHDGAEKLVLTALEFPHRYADAYLRDSLLKGQTFDSTDLGKAFKKANLEDASILYQADPGSLVYGAWNSHRKGRQSKFPRVYASEIIGWNPIAGDRRAGRMDPVNLTGVAKRSEDDWTYLAVGDKVKGEKLSEIGHGNIAPNPSAGGVSISSALRVGTISLAALDRIGFGDHTHSQAVAARALLACYAIAADRLAFASPSVWLRSGCELVIETDVVEWVSRGNTVETLSITTVDALRLLEIAIARAEESGFGWNTESVHVTSGPSLKKAIDFALTKAQSTE